MLAHIKPTKRKRRNENLLLTSLKIVGIKLPHHVENIDLFFFCFWLNLCTFTSWTWAHPMCIWISWHKENVLSILKIRIPIDLCILWLLISNWGCSCSLDGSSHSLRLLQRSWMWSYGLPWLIDTGKGTMTYLCMGESEMLMSLWGKAIKRIHLQVGYILARWRHPHSWTFSLQNQEKKRNKYIWPLMKRNKTQLKD